MAFGLSQMSPETLNTLLGISPLNGSKRAGVSFSVASTNSFQSFYDSFNLTPGDTITRLAVRKMQEAINRPVLLANGQSLNMMGSANGINLTFAGTVLQTATAEQVEQGVMNAGGRDAVRPWLVDGQTKVSVDGRTMIAQVEQSSGGGSGDAKADAVQALAKFGIGSDRLNGNLDEVREALKQSAAQAGHGSDSSLSLSIEFALEDAFKKVRAYEDARNGGATADFDKQLKTNKEQAASIREQLQLGAGSSWALDSAAEDLATFGKDLTALSDQAGLVTELKTLYEDKLAELNRRYVGTETEYYNETRRLSGAYSRLTTGLTTSVPTASAAVSMTGSATVTIEGVEINASSVVSVVNVIADPLVFDLNGDGINLKSAEEGVDFDMDGDGVKTRTGFIQGDDAFLFYNESGEDKVTDGRQLFGNADGHANGFEKLRTFDDNGDGVIDESDEIYDKLRLWQDKNGDGVCDEGETLSLAEAGVTSIRVDYDNVREDDGKGNLIGQTGSFTRADGSEGYAADVWLRELGQQGREIVSEG